jgi:tetratricopeptide (TPR) repeat protein
VIRRQRRGRGALAAGALAALGLGLAGLALPGEARAESPDEALTQAQNDIAIATHDTGTVATAMAKAKLEELSVEARVANGELLLRTKDYEHAGVVFSEIIEGYPNTPSYPDALFLLGETYFASHEYLSARRAYREIVSKSQDPRFQSYVARALARLVDVALRINDLSGLDEVFAHIGEVPPAQVDAGLTYARGKAYYAKQDYGDAQQAFAAIPNGTAFSHQARYFQGLVAMKAVRTSAANAAGAALTAGQAPPPTNYKTAIEAFRAVTVLPPDTDDHKHVIDLAWMAIGRLFYEMEQYGQAAEAYAKVGRESPEFDTMLFELAWVYVRVGDVQRAERALEVLSVADPTSSYIAEGTLLRGDLLLRAGAFDKSLELYQAVRTQYDPLRERVEAFIDSTRDVSVYYDKLSQQALDALDTNDSLPPLAIRWAREAEDGPAAFAVIDDVNQCKTLIRQSQRLIEKLTALTHASNRVRAFPELVAGETTALGLLNRLTRARRTLARGLDGVEPAEVSGEVEAARVERRKWMGLVAQVPVEQADFDTRDSAGILQWNGVSQALSQRSVEVDSLNATINGLRRMLKEDAQRGVARDPASIARFNAEIDANERDLKVYRAQIDELRRLIETGRAQIGLGDARYQNDAVARASFRDALDREVGLVAAGGAGGAAQAYAGQLAPLLATVRGDEDRLTKMLLDLETQVTAKTQELQAKIDLEAAHIEGYQRELDLLDGTARDLVGHVAERNFALVRERLRSLVLRADVGVTEQAWEVREEETARVRSLQGERAREEQLLDEELREVLDDEAAPGSRGAAGGGSH